MEMTQEKAQTIIATMYGNNALAIGQDRVAIFWQFQDDPVDIYHIHIYKEEM